MATNKVGLITTADIAAIIVGTAIAHATILNRIEKFSLNRDGGSFLVLYANFLDDLGRDASGTRIEQVFAMASELLMQTELAE